MKRDLYEALGVSRSASEDEIRKQYRKLARENHPDLHPDDAAAEERFKEIAVAYEVLHDPEKRKNYDEFGEDALNPNFDPNKARDYARWRGAHQRAAAGPRGGPFGGVDINDIFGDLFGGAAGRGGGFGRARRVRGSDVESKVRINFLDALRGTKVKLRLSGHQTCVECHGSGQQNDKTSPCTTCHGTGRQNIGSGPTPFSGTCKVCGGSGRTQGPRCQKCGGKGVVDEPSTLTVTIPPGLDTGSKIRLIGKGEPGLGGAPAGDLYLNVEVGEHPTLKRKGNDLIMTLPVSVPEAVLGEKITVPLVDGKVDVRIPAGSQSGQKLRLRGKGVPQRKGGEAGDLILVLEVRLPKKSNEKLVEAAQAFKEFYESDVRENLKI